MCKSLLMMTKLDEGIVALRVELTMISDTDFLQADFDCSCTVVVDVTLCIDGVIGVDVVIYHTQMEKTGQGKEAGYKIAGELWSR